MIYKTINEQGLKLIKQSEGFRRYAYLDPVGIPTIGYGTIFYPNGTPVKLNDVCTENMATLYLEHDVKQTVEDLNSYFKKIGFQCGSNQFSALVSFAYNLGTGVIKQPFRSMNKAIKSKNHNVIADTFLIYNKAGGKALAGLIVRRRAERELYLTPDSTDVRLA